MKEINIDKIPKKNIYSSPKTDFNEIQNKVLEKIQQKENTQTKIISINHKKRKIYWSIAAAIAIVLGLNIIMFYPIEENTTDKTIKENTQKELYTAEIGNINKKNIAESKEIETKIALENHNTNIQKTSKEDILKKTKDNPQITHAEQVINILPVEDLTMMTQNIESDLYLDLYQ